MHRHKMMGVHHTGKCGGLQSKARVIRDTKIVYLDNPNHVRNGLLGGACMAPIARVASCSTRNVVLSPASPTLPGWGLALIDISAPASNALCAYHTGGVPVADDCNPLLPWAIHQSLMALSTFRIAPTCEPAKLSSRPDMGVYAG